MTKRYQRALETSHHMIPSNYIETLEHLQNITQLMDSFYKYCKQMGTMGSTSVYRLIVDAVDEFYGIVQNDLKSSFADLHNFQSAYTEGFAKKYLVMSDTLKSASDNVMYLVEAAIEAKTHIHDNADDQKTRKWQLHDMIGTVKSNLRKVQTGDFLASGTPSSTVNITLTPYLPTSIYKNRNVKTECKTKLTTLASISIPQNLETLYNMDITSLTMQDVYESILNSSLINTHEQLQIKIQDFSTCSSGYAHLLANVATWYADVTKVPVLDFGGDFIFEQQVQPLIKISNKLHNEIMSKFISNELSYRELSILFGAGLVSEITQTLNNFETLLHNQFSATLRNYMKDQQIKIKSAYNDVLEHMSEFELYKKSIKNNTFLTLAKTMELWKKPMVNLNGDILVTNKLRSTETWKTWPNNMGLKTFRVSLAKPIINKIVSDVFNSLSTSLTNVDNKVYLIQTSIISSLKILEKELSTFLEESEVDQKFIL